MELDISIIFARIWGLFYLIFGLLFIITKQLGRTIELTEDRKFTIATGYNTLIMGIITVAFHNIWVWDWRILITLLGWSTVLKGIHKIGFPDSINKQAQRFEKNQWISAIFLSGLGGWLVYKGFWFQ